MDIDCLQLMRILKNSLATCTRADVSYSHISDIASCQTTSVDPALDHYCSVFQSS